VLHASVADEDTPVGRDREVVQERRLLDGDFAMSCSKS
jgi:hypothetical protein